MRSGKKTVSCLPCAKRKVRCDKVQPCCHCKRRRHEDCVYPSVTADRDTVVQNQAERIKSLEKHIQNLEADHSNSDSPNPKQKDVVTAGQSRDKSELSGNAFGTNTKNTPLTLTQGRTRSKTSGLVMYDDEVTYIETPMWYSWTVNDTMNAAANSKNGVTQVEQDSYYFPTVLDLFGGSNITDIAAQSIPTHHLDRLWKAYLDNVHPLVNIFFSWEIENLVQKAKVDFTGLAVGERTLILAISFIAAMSLSQTDAIELFSESQSQVLSGLQKRLEYALLSAGYVTSTNIHILQAFMLYMVAIRDRARPATLFSLMGLASRVAERLGIHRDGEYLGLSVVRSEERRRMWWYLQYMEMVVAKFIGTLCMTVYGDWDAKIPTNLDDNDLNPNMTALPPGRQGLTTMSDCLWRYHILHTQRELRQGNGIQLGLSWMLSPHVSFADKEKKFDELEQTFGEHYLRYCDLLEPLHTHIQIEIRQFLLAVRRILRQPELMNAKIADMSKQDRNVFLDLSKKSLSYYVMSHTTDSIKGFRWHNETWFQWISFVYVILEAHHRFDQVEVLELWKLIEDVCIVHPELGLPVRRPELLSIVPMILVAWQERDEHLRKQQGTSINTGWDQYPQWILELRESVNWNFKPPPTYAGLEAEQSDSDFTQFLPEEFDLDFFDWSTIGQQYMNMG